MLARGVRRGQRRAWLVCLALLIAVAVLHLVKGVDVEEAIVALAAAGYLWLHRESFQAKTDVARLGRGLLSVAGAAVLTVAGGNPGDRAGHLDRQPAPPTATTACHGRGPPRRSLERMVGVTHIALPSRLNEFFSPAMATAAAGLALALVVVLFRPVVAHRHQAAGRVTAPGGGRRVAGGRRGPAAVGAGASRAGRGGGDSAAGAGRRGPGVAPDWPTPGRWSPGTGRAPSTTSPCGRTSSSSSGETRWWPTPCTEASAWCHPIPIGPVAEREEAWRAFRRYVDEHGWALGGLGSARSGCRSIGPPGCTTSTWGMRRWCGWGASPCEGGRFKGLRQAVNRVAKYGYRISFHDPSWLDPELRAAAARGHDQEPAG